MSTKSYRDLRVWQEAMELAVESHRIADRMARDHAYGLGSQIRRAATSVPSNLAEGSRRDHRREYRHFVSIARGSLAELETQLELASRLSCVDGGLLAGALERAGSVGRMLTRLSRSLRS